jgi:hypothetical protein
MISACACDTPRRNLASLQNILPQDINIFIINFFDILFAKPAKFSFGWKIPPE